MSHSGAAWLFPAAAFALFLLAGCVDPTLRTPPEDPDERGAAADAGPTFSVAAHEPPPDRSGGPYNGDATIALVVVYFSFELNTSRHVSGDLGGHCLRDDWTLEPASVMLRGPPEQLPQRLVVREIHPDEDDARQVGNFGTAPTSQYGAATLPATFDRDRVLGSITWDGDQPYFDAHAIPNGNWLLATFDYEVEDSNGNFTVTETLHMRGLGDVPMDVDRSTWVCH